MCVVVVVPFHTGKYNIDASGSLKKNLESCGKASVGPVGPYWLQAVCVGGKLERGGPSPPLAKIFC